MRIRLIICLLYTVLTSMMLAGQCGLRPRGDVNCDWEVTVADINTLVDSVLNGAKYHALYSYATDVNGDKEINIADINALIDCILGGELPPMPSYSGTLPVMYINTEGYHNIDSKDEYLHADWWLDNMGIEDYESIGSADAPLGMQIKGRGNYTWTLKKKPFRIKLDEKQPIMGMKSNRHFCLLSHADDHFAKLKNTLGFELSRRIGMPYTPEQRPIEVVLNGQYIGLYFLTEKIRVEKNRVNIEEQMDGDTIAENMTGGWLLEIDNNRNDNTIYIKERNEGSEWFDWLWVTSHSPEYLSKQQRHYITQYLTTVNSAIYNDDKTDNQWEEYIDIDSLACFYIIGEILDDIEYFSGSCYMYKHYGDSTKLIFGPVWDFGNSFMRKNHTNVTNYDYFIYQECYFHQHWIEEIVKYPHFQEVLKAHWKSFYESDFNGLDIDRFIDEHVSTISQAWYCDAARWRRTELIEWEARKYKLNVKNKIEWLQSQWSASEVEQ